MTQEREYSIWLIPSGSIYTLLSDLIFLLNRQHKSPNFEPHVTLLGKLTGEEKDLARKSQQLSKILQPFPVHLTTLDYTDEYYRCLFAKVRETYELTNANLKAREIFLQNPEQPYFPHLSLMYGNFPEETKERIIPKIGRLDKGFEAENLYLFLTTGQVKSWREIARFQLK